MTRSRRVLITGGAGFIGSHLTEELLEHGDTVVALDNYLSSSKRNISHLQTHPRYHFVKGSVTNKPLVSALIKGCDVVFHLAAAVGVKMIVQSPIESLQTNIDGTRYVLEYCAKMHKKVLITSSSEVYGHQPRKPVQEESRRVLGPTTIDRWSYSSAKAVDEYFAIAYGKRMKLPYVVVRLFNTVGPRQVPFYGMVLPRFVQQAVCGKTLTVYGDGRQMRTFIHVKDVVRAIRLLGAHAGAEGKVFNVGGNQSVTIRGLARLVIERARSSSKISLVPYTKVYKEDFEDVRYRIPDVSRLRKHTGFLPGYTLTDIIDDTITYYAQHRSAL